MAGSAEDETSTGTGTGRATIVSVAAAAGVSVGTVSNVLNSPHRVSAGTLTRVKNAMDDLGFVPSRAARSMATQNPEDLAIVVPSLVNSLSTDLALGAHTEASRNGRVLSILLSDFSWSKLAKRPERPDELDEVLDNFASSRLAGFILETLRDPTRAIQRLKRHIGSVVVVNWDSPGAEWCSVVLDNQRVGELTVEHVASMGVSHAYFVAPHDTVQSIVDRRTGASRRGRELGVAITDIHTTSLHRDSAEAAVEQIIRERPRDFPIAILGVTDELALGVLDELEHLAHIRVPEDVIVMGMDANRLAGDSARLTLSTFDFPAREMGSEAVRLLLDEILHDDHEHKRVMLQPTLRLRESSRRVPEAEA